jgi:hypothetical protein
MISYVIQQYGVKNFLDAPCGGKFPLNSSTDFFWQPLVKELEEINYTGIDIVPSLITNHSRQYLGIPNLHFAHLDMSRTLVPRYRFDIIMTRDMLQHNTLEDALTIVRNIEQSGAKYFLTNFHANPDPNVNVVPGSYYPINVRTCIFLFPGLAAAIQFP